MTDQEAGRSVNHPWETVTAHDFAMASLTSPIREAIYMSDRGQPCVCSERGPCYMHAQQERATEALTRLLGITSAAAQALHDLEHAACQDVTVLIQRRLRDALTSVPGAAGRHGHTAGDWHGCPICDLGPGSEGE